MKRVALYTLGCKLNYTETAAIGKQFVENGYSLVKLEEPADIVVINSCSVTYHAERECRQLIRKILRRTPNAFLAVVGCYSQVQSKQIAEIEGVDLVLGSNEKLSLLDLIHEYKKKSYPNVYVSCPDSHKDFKLASSVGFEDRTRAFIKVQDGCDYNCTYCIVPLARGKSRSVTINGIIKQVSEAVNCGYKEIVLTGVNVGDYGKNESANLLELLAKIVVIDGLERIRVSSIEPNLLTNELLDFWFKEKKLCNHWHIPLQSGSDAILSKMRRRYNAEMYRDKIEIIRANTADAGIGADVIVGFPGETEELFNETYNYLTGLPLSYLHVFSYSERPNTTASEYSQKISPNIIYERSKKLHQLSRQKRQNFHDKFIGKTVPVLFESVHNNGYISGLTEEYIRVEIKSCENISNKIVNVKIEQAGPDKCFGKNDELNIIPALTLSE